MIYFSNLESVLPNHSIIKKLLFVPWYEENMNENIFLQANCQLLIIEKRINNPLTSSDTFGRIKSMFLPSPDAITFRMTILQIRRPRMTLKSRICSTKAANSQLKKFAEKEQVKAASLSAGLLFEVLTIRGLRIVYKIRYPWIIPSVIRILCTF